MGCRHGPTERRVAGTVVTACREHDDPSEGLAPLVVHCELAAEHGPQLRVPTGEEVFDGAGDAVAVSERDRVESPLDGRLSEHLGWGDRVVRAEA